MKQQIWTPRREGILRFLIDKQNEGYRIVSISPHFMCMGGDFYDWRGYIVIGEKE
jgi:hypothetical protein